MKIKQESELKKNELELSPNLIHLLEEIWINPRKRATDIKRMSDFYIDNPQAETPWQEEFVQAAQEAYYLPLNYLRTLRVLKQLQDRSLLSEDRFLKGIRFYLEFGSGLSPSFFSLADSDLLSHFEKFEFIESSQRARQRHEFLVKKYLELSEGDKKFHHKMHWSNTLSEADKVQLKKSLVIWSFSLTEIKNLPSWFFDVGAMIIIEPATKHDGRRLLQIRQELIKKNYTILAPCTHQQECPLLVDSQSDWCHDRILFKQPEAFAKIDDLLPFKNSNLTLSYLVATKHKMDLPEKKNLARVIGDLLDEKGKTRQLICWRTKREFFSQLKRQGSLLEFSRGDLIEIDMAQFNEVQNELRPK